MIALSGGGRPAPEPARTLRAAFRARCYGAWQHSLNGVAQLVGCVRIEHRPLEGALTRFFFLIKWGKTYWVVSPRIPCLNSFLRGYLGYSRKDGRSFYETYFYCLIFVMYTIIGILRK